MGDFGPVLLGCLLTLELQLAMRPKAKGIPALFLLVSWPRLRGLRKAAHGNVFLFWCYGVGRA